MIKEFAFGLAQRHYFQDSSSVCDWMNIDKDTYMSLYEFDDEIKDFFAKKHTLSGFDGPVYIPDEFILDVDGKDNEDLENARQKTVGLLLLLDDLGIPYKLYFSGNKGFHVGIPATAFRWKPDPLLHLKVKDALTNAGIFDYADPSVTDKIRLIRVVNTMNLKAQLWKREISRKDLDVKDITAHMQNIGKKPGPVSEFELECNPVFDVMKRSKYEEQSTPEFINQGRNPDPVNYPCISSMLASNAHGERHATALRLSAWFRWLYPESIVCTVMERWRQQVDDPSSPFTMKEMESIVNSSYDAHGGSGNRYGCGDKIMDNHCKNTCKLYKSKKNQTVMDSNTMETSLINFLTSNQKPLDFGDIWPGENFPIYPGEVVVVQAPPKSMKTMFLQNLMNGF